MNSAAKPPPGWSKPSPDSVARRYDRLAPIYRALGVLFLLRSSIRRAAIDALRLVPGALVLEVGCGNGTNLSELSSLVGPAGRVVGTDVSAGMLRRAHVAVDRLDLANVEIIQQDPGGLAVDTSFDAVLFSLSYTVIPDRLAVLRSAWTLLRPGGRLVIMDSGLPDSRLGRLLGPPTRALSRLTFLGDPHTLPSKDLEALGAQVECRRFAPGVYYVCSAAKPS
jgi:ubiquinone/menaquinone biosynthesis C-methylase UbiE